MASYTCDNDVVRLPMNAEQFTFGKWTISYEKSHILASICHTAEACESNPDTSCRFCFFSRELKFPHLPDMVFPNNKLVLKWNDKGRIEFTALEALRCVDITREPVQVSCADEWQESRPGAEQKIVKSFDWTFTTDYKGTFLDGLEHVPTDEKINMELLKQREKILFYHDLALFEDELHDHGISVCSVKIRVMPSSWFILLRYFLRVDNVLTKVNDTRMFYKMDSPYVLMEYTAREADIPNLKVPAVVLKDPNELAQYVPIVSQSRSKVMLPTDSVSSS